MNLPLEEERILPPATFLDMCKEDKHMDLITALNLIKINLEGLLIPCTPANSEKANTCFALIDGLVNEAKRIREVSDGNKDQ